ncbi:MAG: hypothetical protein AMXMBFR58_28320 [Phycisphaerae bacterium]
MRESHHPPDEEGVTRSFQSDPRSLSSNDERRFRFQDIVSVNLNTRRALREIVMPEIAAQREEIAALREALKQSFTPPP